MSLVSFFEQISDFGGNVGRLLPALGLKCDEE
jgi:hypothetical protein